MLRALGVTLFLIGTLHADVAMLKGGARVAGRVVEKTDHYEITVDGVLRTYLKDEVDKIVTSPKEFLGDADKMVDEARADYQKALTLNAPAEQNAVLKAAIVKVAQAREAYGVALDLFPEDGTLGKQIMIIMQLMRLLRERVHLDDTRLPGSPAPITRPTAPPVIQFDDAFTTLLDAAKRGDPARRASAIAGLGAARDLLQPFAVVHLAGAGQEADVDKVAKSLNLLVQNGIVGTLEGHAVRDLDNWIAHGDYDLAVMAFINDYRSIDTPAVRFVWSYALLRLVQARKRGIDRPVSAFDTVKIALAGGPDHIAALGKSIKAGAVCNVCGGEGRFRCTNCHRKKETKIYCQRCKGSGHITSSLGAKLNCPRCLAKGIVQVIKCEKCKNGYVDCKQCEKPKPPPSMEDIVGATVCTACEGRGMAFRNAAVPCRACLGLGAKLIPKSDPSKVLP